MADLEPGTESKPVPDPTVLTTQALMREIAALKELLQQRIGEMEKRYAVLMEEREKQTETIFIEQRRAMGVAEEEREKSARALRLELSRQIEQGDTSLRDHILGQVEQIKLLAQSMDEQSRLRVDAVSNQLAMITQAQQDAISKAERANEKQTDEFKASVDLQLKALRDSVQDLTRRFDKLA